MTATAATKLDEMALRKLEFAEGVAIVLCDGQTWRFPLPKAACLYPVPDPTSGPAAFDMAVGYDLGPEYDHLLRVYQSAGTAYEDACGLMGLAACLLRRNYSLEPSDFASLLRWPLEADPDREARVEMWRAIKAVVLGQGEAAEQDPEVQPAAE